MVERYASNNGSNVSVDADQPCQCISQNCDVDSSLSFGGELVSHCTSRHATAWARATLASVFKEL